MKVLLLNLPFVFEKKSDIVLSHCLGIFQIASFLRDNACEVVILDALQEGFGKIEKYNNSFYRVGLGDDEILNRVDDSFDLIGISVPFSHLAKLAHDLTDKIKAKHNNNDRKSVV